MIGDDIGDNMRDTVGSIGAINGDSRGALGGSIGDNVGMFGGGSQRTQRCDPIGQKPHREETP